jgi:hypothetical protein
MAKPFIFSLAASASASDPISTNPKPLDRPVNLSVIILVVTTVPQEANIAANCDSVV